MPVGVPVVMTMVVCVVAQVVVVQGGCCVVGHSSHNVAMA
jgi:hypothetical protein